jgi:hypothetical protein
MRDQSLPFLQAVLTFIYETGSNNVDIIGFGSLR